MAAIMRDAQTPDFGTRQIGNVSQDAAGYVSPNYTKYAGTLGREATNVNQTDGLSGLDHLLGAIVPVANKVGENIVQRTQAEAYMQGQAAAASGKAEDALDTNIFTKDWAGAGWHDTKARLVLADEEAQTAADMPKLAQQDPAAMQDYLNQRRNRLMDQMSGMSADAQKGYMAQMLTSDQHAIAKQANAHAQFVIDQQAAAIQTSFSVANDTMNSSKADPVAYSKATDNALANLYGNVLSNPNLPAKQKHDMITQAMGLSLESNNEQLYEKARDMVMPDGTSMLDKLPFEDQSKLAKQYQQSQKDTATMRNTTYNTQLGLVQSKISDPLAEPVSWDDMNAFITKGEGLGVINGDKRASLVKEWADGNEKKQKNVAGAQAWAAGDVNSMFSLGVDDKQGAHAWLASMQRKGVDISTAVSNLAQIGLSTGSPAAFSTVGELMRPSISLIGNGKNIDSGALDGLNSVLGAVDQAEQKGNPGARSAFLSSFDDASQARILDYWSGLKAGKSPTVAAADAAQNALDSASMTPAQKGALVGAQAKENLDALNQITPKGMFAQIWEKNPFRFQENADRDSIRASASWFENPERVEAAMARAKVEYLGELTDIGQQHPYLDADARQKMALAHMGNRTINTDGGPVIMPKGQTIQSFFGVQPSASNDLVAGVLNDLHTPAKGNRVIYNVTADGRMQWQEYGPSGSLMNGGGTFDPRAIAAGVQARQNRLSDNYRQTDGDGVKRTGSTGDVVQYNGDNTIGIGTQNALQIRDDLVKYEDVRSKPYDDASGKVVNGKKVQTVGVGVSTTNDFYPPVEADGRVSQANMNRSFTLASNAAMKQANAAAITLPPKMQSVDSLRLYTQLAYQGGSVPTDLIKAMQSGDRTEAYKALYATPQYKMAHVERRQFYTDLMQSIMPFTQ